MFLVEFEIPVVANKIGALPYSSVTLTFALFSMSILAIAAYVCFF